MATAQLPLQQQVEDEYDRTVRDDIEAFSQQIQAFLNGQLTDDQFRPYRLRRGIYGQRQPGVQMIRTKIPGGIATAAQIDRLAAISDQFAAGKAHTTTRQNVQFHFVALAQVPALLHQLADVRLTTREACYNTVRNVTATPTAGLERGEPFDIRPHVRRTAFAFLHKELTDNLPRKFKIAFSSGVGVDMLTDIHDVGLTAIVREENGERREGFRMVIGGGLGSMPAEPHLLDEFVPVERLVNRIEAVIRVFNLHGNRTSKFKARLKFVLRERGFAWVKETIEREYADILENGGIPMPEVVPEGFGGFQQEPDPIGNGSLLPIVNATAPAAPGFDRWLETNVREQKQDGYAIVTVLIEQGNLTSAQLRGLATLSRTAGDGLVRFGIDQNILLANVPAAHLRRLYAGLRELGLADAGAGEIEDVISCPGGYSCNLAITKSMSLGAALAEVVREHEDRQARRLSIHISGCPNSCGQHWTSDFGFYGNARKIEGREVPYYQMLLGGGYDEQGLLRYGLTIQALPAKSAPVALRRVLEHWQSHRTPGETFRQYVLRHKVETFRALTNDLAKPAEIEPEMYMDWGDEVAFSKHLGRGECAS